MGFRQYYLQFQPTTLNHHSNQNHGASWLSGSVGDLQASDCRCKLPAGLNLLWCCDPGQSLYPHVHSLDPGVNWNLVGPGRILCIWIISNYTMAADQSCVLPGELRWLMNERVLWPQGVIVCSLVSSVCIRYQAIIKLPPLPFNCITIMQFWKAKDQHVTPY